MHSHMSYLVDNTGVSNLLEHMVSKTYLYEIHLWKLILSSSHKLLCSMEDNPPSVDMCWVVILISCVTSRHIGCPYIQAPSMMYSSNYLISIIILIIISLSCAIYWASWYWCWIIALGKFLHDIRAIPNSYNN